MNIIKTGKTYKVYGEDLTVLDTLPAYTYKVGYSDLGGFFLEKLDNLEVKENKVYGEHEQKALKVMNRFSESRKNLGVILSGDKGIGKSLFSRLLSQMAISSGMPVILVDDYNAGLCDFINSIKMEAMVLFDEFDKNFAGNRNDGVQAKMLSLFDGTSNGKKLFVITCNSYLSLSEYLINRPGRFHFHFRFNYPSAEDITEYLQNNVKAEYYSEIEKVIDFALITKLNYDCLAAIVSELNAGEKFEDAIQDLNILNDGMSRLYDITMYTAEGICFESGNRSVDFFSGKNKSFWLTDSNGVSAMIKFNMNDLIYDKHTEKFILAEGKFKVTLDEEDLTGKEEERYKELHYKCVDFVRSVDRGIHYRLV